MTLDGNKHKIARKNVLGNADAREETRASKEEIYLEKTEEKLRAVLISEDPSDYAQPDSGWLDRCSAEEIDQELEHASEALITGDSDDPPPSESDVEEMVSMSANARRLEQAANSAL